MSKKPFRAENPPRQRIKWRISCGTESNESSPTKHPWQGWPLQVFKQNLGWWYYELRRHYRHWHAERTVCRSSSKSFNAANALSTRHVNVDNVVLTHNIITQDFVWKPAGVTPARGVLLAESFDSLPHEIRHLILCHGGFSTVNGLLDSQDPKPFIPPMVTAAEKKFLTSFLVLFYSVFILSFNEQYIWNFIKLKKIFLLTL